MKCRMQGFDVEITNEDGCPRVRVSLKNGECVVDTNRLSVAGIEHMADVFARAAPIALVQMDNYWYRRQEQMRQRAAQASKASSASNSA